MKKLLIPILLLSSCKLQQGEVYYSSKVKKCIHNLEQLENFIQQDYLQEQIPRYVANNYLTVVRYTKCSLLKDSIDKEDCFD
jgi:hypothetical protein